MSSQFAVVGDIHGNSAALHGMLSFLEGRACKYIFTGDFVNRGPDSAAVLQALVELKQKHSQSVFVAGNHDRALLRGLETGSLSQLLKMGGAATVRSYVADPRGNIGHQLKLSVPAAHVEFLKNLVPYFLSETGLLVTHGPSDHIASAIACEYHIFGHVPQDDRKPAIGPRRAAIDTGCGTFSDGRLTALLYPSLTPIQVDAEGRIMA